MSAPADPMSFRWAADLRRVCDLLATKLALLLFRGGSVMLPGICDSSGYVVIVLLRNCDGE